MERNIQIGDGSSPTRLQQREGSSEIPEEIQDVDALGLEFIAIEEGLKLKPYLDSAGIPTIGVGATYYQSGKRVTMKDKPLTRQEALDLFKWHLDIYEKGVWSVTRDDITQNMFNALVSICFNIGTSAFKKSTLLRRVNENIKDPSIKAAFEMWQNSGEDKGILLPRRKRVVFFIT
jgi:lysozyme